MFHSDGQAETIMVYILLRLWVWSLPPGPDLMDQILLHLTSACGGLNVREGEAVGSKEPTQW